MMNMEQSIKRMNTAESPSSEEPATKLRRTVEQEDKVESDESDGEVLLQTTKPRTKPPTDSATDGETGVSTARLEQNALLSEISEDFEQEEDLGPDINQQLADIINKLWSKKLSDTKLKEKTEKYRPPANCEKLIVPRVNAEIWDN